MNSGLPFEGLRVIDLGTFWAGPFLGCYLGAFGADVVKVEGPRRPDQFRYIAAFPQQGADWYERSGLFQATNLNKRDVTLDLSQERGQELFAQLLDTADVLIENFSPRVMENFGYDWDTVHGRWPTMVMVRMPGYGLSGPWRDHVGFGNTFEHMGGLSHLTGYPDSSPLGPGGYADPIAGMHGVVGAIAALEERVSTGIGRLVEIAQTEVVAAMCGGSVADYQLSGDVEGRHGNRDVVFAPQGVYRCAGDDEHIAVTVRDDDDWQRMCAGLGWDRLARETDLVDAAGRQTRHEELDHAIARWSEVLPAATAEAQLLRLGVPAARVLRVSEMYNDPQLAARGYYQSLEHPRSGIRRYPGWPMRFSFDHDSHHRRRAPLLGEHNAEILGGELGLSTAELDILRADEIIAEALPDE